MDAQREKQAGKPPTGQGIPLSESVNGVIIKLGIEQQVPAWELVKTLFERHPEYGFERAKEMLDQPGPPSGETRRVGEWLAAVKKILNPKTVKELHGRLFIVALCRLDQNLSQYLTGRELFQKIEKEIETQQPVESLFNPILPSDPAPLCLDNPTEMDRLGRRGFARALAIRLNLIWSEYNPNRPESLLDRLCHWRKRPGARGSFSMHLHGPWGAGKTSLLHLLRLELQPESRRENGRGASRETSRASPLKALKWIVVDFNAWKHQRLDPPWWFLMDAVYRQALKQVSTIRAFWLWTCENLWRLFTGHRDIVSVLATLLLVAGAAYWLSFSLGWALSSKVPGFFSDLYKNAEALTKVLALASTLLSAVYLMNRSLWSGSAWAAQAFIQAGSDPMERVSLHFRRILGRIDHPVIIFIDDLDRCQGGYVVHLLEGIQTLFYDSRVVYLVAADRRWLYACFEKSYELFSNAVNEPGRRLGSLFLEKAFELSVSVPRLSPGRQKAYWRAILQGGTDGIEQQYRTIEQEAQDEFADAATEHQVITLLTQEVSDSGDPVRQQARRQAAVERLASARVEMTTQYFLEPFAPLMEPNPRAMKRLLNAYSIHRDLALLGGINVLADEEMRKQLALWTILCLRWPGIEEHLIQQAAGQVQEASPDILALMNCESLKKLLRGDGIGTALKVDSVSMLAGIRASDSHTAGVFA
ncbi:MAG: P-loop NTPase fold protein [Syntrophobacteraceae bacterium]